MGLLKMVRYASEPACRKRTVHAHFGFEDDFEAGCGSCDVCVELAAWQDEHMPSPRALTRGRGDAEVAADDPTHGLQRGDWLDVQGIGLCCVVRVHRHGDRARVDVERASDLKARTVDLRRKQWRRVER